jgi:hypothetical protein
MGRPTRREAINVQSREQFVDSARLSRCAGRELDPGVPTSHSEGACLLALEQEAEWGQRADRHELKP